ncbi:MAG TPA: winged helix-turn-helix domain-containing protein [Pyrinomonadaceae bacterium]|nr:winged helix-turn-helix domain-containing protein [Pyrinomonadaceae bacterium]
MSKPDSYSYLFDRYRLSIARKELLYEDHPIPLNRTQFEILRILVENQGEFVGKERLVADVCGNSTAGANTIEQAVYDLRGKLHDAADASRFIETKRRMGYRFVMNVVKVSDEATGQLPAEKLTVAGDAAPDEDLQARARDLATQTAQPLVERVRAEDSKGGMVTFREWRRGPGQMVKWVLACGVVLTVALSIGGTANKWDNNLTILSLSIAQFFVLLFALIYVLVLRGPKGLRPIKGALGKDDRLDKEIREATGYGDPAEWDEARDIAKNALERYTMYWYGVLGSWILLYAWLAFKGLPNSGLSSQPLNIVTTFFNNCNTILIILCYNILNKPIEIKPGKRNISDTSLGIGSITLVTAFLIVEIFLVKLFPAFQREVLYGANLASGIAAGIAMALFVGRLQSKFLGPPPKLIIALYSYTAIQSLFVFLVEGTEAAVILIDKTTVALIAVILINIALILKCLLYLYMAWLFQSGRLLFYLVQVRRTYKKVETEWQGFRQVLDEES